MKGNYAKMMKRGIFISYRRDTGSTMARMVFDRLRLEKHYNCFLDVEKLNAGNFREKISSEMDNCDIFLLILSKDALDRCSNPNDNVRLEILTAIDKNLAIIPVTAEDFIWPEKMPEGIECIQNYNAIPYIQVYSDQFFEKLYSFIKKVRAEGRVKEYTSQVAKATEQSARAQKIIKDLGHTSANVISDLGKSTAEAAKEPGNPRNLPIIIGAVAVITVIVVFLGQRNSMLQQEASVTAESQQIQVESAAAQTTPAETETTAQQETESESPSAVQTGTAGITYTAGADYIDFFTAGTTFTDAEELPLSVKVKGTYIDGEAWAKFTTTGDSDAKYYVTLQNLTVGSPDLVVNIFDEDNNQIEAAAYNDHSTWMNVSANGQTHYMMFDSLDPDTTYYVRIANGRHSHYSLAITLEGQQNDICIEKPIITSNEEFYTATNQDEAPNLTLNMTYDGSYEDGFAWLSFTTGSDSPAIYYVTMQNLSAGSKALVCRVFDEYGNNLEAEEYNDHSTWMNIDNDGKYRYMAFDSLAENTTYYICIEGGSKADYQISVGDNE